MPIPHELVCLSNLSPHATILYIDGGGKGYIHSDTCGAEGEGYKRGKGILEGGGVLSQLAEHIVIYPVIVYTLSEQLTNYIGVIITTPSLLL